MSELPQEFILHNQTELEDLAWELEAAAGQFSLMLARCNYADLRSQLVEALQQLCPLDIQVLVLQSTDIALYTRIQTELGEKQPGALMVFGLETVQHLEQLLSTANQVREEFRKNCPFPIVLWVTDDVQRLLVRAAPDLESWATKTHFTLPPEALNQGLQQACDRLFSILLDGLEDRDELHPDLDLGLFNLTEIAVAVQELKTQGQELDPTVQASLDFVRGLQSENPLTALEYFEKSCQFWRQCQETIEVSFETQNFWLQEGLLLFYIAQAQYTIAASASQTPGWEQVRRSVQDAIAKFEQATRSDLISRCIPLLERVLQKLEAWDELEKIAQQGITLHRTYGSLTRLSQDYGFLAKVALEQQQWIAAQQSAQQALVTLEDEPNDRLWLRGLYLLFLAQAERQLGNPEAAIAHLIKANAATVSDRGYPKFAVRILEELRDLYFERHQYLEAFEAKQARLSIEQQYGIRAFVGAGRLQPQRQAAVAEFQAATDGMVAPEIAAAGRQQDLARLIERIGRNDCKLIVIHGGSGVGKSSIVNAGLVPELKQKAIGVYENLPVVVQQYTSWAVTLEQNLLDALTEKLGYSVGVPHTYYADAVGEIFRQLRQNEQRNLRTVLIFDQFEEFFFTQPDPAMRLLFFQFLGQCLQTTSDISRVKVVLSLRKDYLHYLLEINQMPAMEQTGIDPLSRNVLYELGNFTPRDARIIIQNLADRVRFYLEPALIDRLVEDLAQEIGAVRPIELQVVGAQLQAENITTLAQYQAFGRESKQELVKRYLYGVVTDCGDENRQLAELILYLLTDEKGTRPLKTRAELERDLTVFEVDVLAKASSLDLVLHIFSASGLAVVVPEAPDNRYQLVHDYIATFIRQQQSPQLEKLLADLDIERQRRQQAEQALATLEEQKQVAEAELKSLTVEQNRAKQELIVTTRQVRRRSTLGAVALGLAIVAVPTASISFIGANHAAQRARSAEASVDQAKKQVVQVEANAKQRQQEADINVQDAKQQVQQAQDKQREADQKAQKANQAVERAKSELSQISKKSAQEIQTAQAERQQAQAQADQARQEQREANQQVRVAQAVLRNAQHERELALAQREIALEGTNLERAGVASMRRFQFQQTEALLAATRAGQQLKSVIQTNHIKTLADYPALSPLLALQTSLDTLRETLFEGHQGPVYQVVFSPDGQRLATGGDDGTARLWNLQGQELAKFEGHQGPVSQVVFSPDGQRLATGGADGTARLWN
ncbi:MAG TPA: hypothetical protein V6D10_19115, partial [Trichocoleus sp.]